MQNLFLSPFYAPLFRMGLLLLATTIQIGLRETSAVQIPQQICQELKESLHFLSWSGLKYLALFTNSTWKITVFINSFGLIFTCHYQDIFILKWVVKVLVLGNLYQHQMKTEVKTKWIRTKLLFSVWSTHIFSAHQSRKT